MQDLEQYGFLGPIVGIAGLFIAAGTAILFGWSRTFDTWKPPATVLPKPLSQMVTLLCSIAIFLAWIFAEPENQPAYIRSVIWLATAGVLALLGYIGLWAYCGRFRRPLVGPNNQPAGEETLWGGFWLTPKARSAYHAHTPVEVYLKGNLYDVAEVWPGLSRALSAVVTAAVLLAALVGGTAALSTAATAAQVALTNKAARQVFDRSEVRGLPPKLSPKSTEPSK
jgi:hypothetical protein